MPVGIFGRRGAVEAAVIKGNAPLLLSRATLQSLKTVLDFQKDQISLLDSPMQAMTFNEAGQITINMLDFRKREQETLLAEQSVRVVSRPMKAGFHPFRELTKREARVIQSQSGAWQKGMSKCLVAGLFSPARFTKVAEELGKSGLAFDIKDGWDLTKPATQREVSQALEEAQPELLVVCPECKHWGGWYRLNQHQLSLEDRLQNMRVAKKQVDFCVQEIKNQLRRGGRVMIEHPWSSSMWSYGPMAKVTRQMRKCRVDMCAYGLQDDCGMPILKPTAHMAT